MSQINNFEKKKLKKRWKFLITSAMAIGFVGIATPLLTGCSLNSSFSFGNFQSYLNPIIQNVELPGEYGNMNYIYYGTNYQIPNHIYNNSVNLTIATDNEVCSLAYHGLIQKYNWADFGLEDPVTHQLITKISQLQTIFTPMAWATANAYTWLVQKTDPTFNLLQYAIPYFLQNIVFCYRGAAIPQLPPEHTSYYQIFKYITEWNTKTNSYDPGHPWNRFIKPGYYATPKLMMVKSPRTDFDIANIVRQEETLVKNGTPIQDLWEHNIDINPQYGLLGMPASTTPSIQWYANVLNTISAFFTNFPNAISFNTNSNPIINALALNEINGGFIYNGDSVYTIQGGAYAGTSYFNKHPITNNNIHIVMPYNNLIAMDNIVINKSDSPSVLEKADKIAYQLGLSGSMLYENTIYNQPIWNEPKNILHIQPQISLIGNVKNAAGQVGQYYAYLSMSNFNWVDYTPELRSIYQYASNPGPDGYFANSLAGPGLSSQALINKSIWALDMQSALYPARYHLEMPFNELGDSNLGIAFVTFMNDI